MKRIFLAASLMIASIALSAQHKLNITVDGIDKVQGKLFVAVYDEANFMKQRLYGTIAKVDAQEITVNIDSVAVGSYAVVVFHDENSNNKLDMGIYGPSEPYCYSNNTKAKYGPPSFTECMIKVEDDVVCKLYLSLCKLP